VRRATTRAELDCPEMEGDSQVIHEIDCERCGRHVRTCRAATQRPARFCSETCSSASWHGRSRRVLFERLEEKIDLTDPGGCWPWLGTRPNGYGMVDVDGPMRKAHRVLYELVVGPVPGGLVLDHLCRNRACVNPDHLEPVTQRENALRGIGPTAENARKRRCLHGHPFDAVAPDGHRVCRTCARDRYQRYLARKALA
jgi:hypothetical protein